MKRCASLLIQQEPAKPQRFTATENAFEKGIENTSAKQGAKLAGEWVEELRKADFPGAKGLVNELEKLEKLLGA